MNYGSLVIFIYLGKTKFYEKLEMAAQRAARNVFTTVTDSVFPGSSCLIDGDKNIYFERGK